MIEAMIASALESAAAAERYGLGHDMIILSAKVSGVRDLLDVYTKLAARCDYPLHLGLTEAGMGSKGLIASTAGLAPLLLAGIGDTIRVSLTPKPNGDRTEEVQAAQQILQSLSIRSFMPQVTSCPGCGRTTSTYFQELAEQIQTYLRTSMPEWRKKYPGVEELKLAVMGCVVNGPGESKHANLGISLPGTFEDPVAPVYVDGKLSTTLRGDTIVAEFKQILDNYVESHYGQGAKSGELVGVAIARQIQVNAPSATVVTSLLSRNRATLSPILTELSVCGSTAPRLLVVIALCVPPLRLPLNPSRAFPPTKPRKCSTRTFAFQRISMMWCNFPTAPASSTCVRRRPPTNNAASPSSAFARIAARSASSANTATWTCRFAASCSPCTAAPGMVLSHARQFYGGPPKFKPNPLLARGFNAEQERPPVNDPNLRPRVAAAPS